MSNHSIERFFASPRVFDDSEAQLSVLYLLRRDIDQCMGTDPNTGEENCVGQVLFPGAMAIMAGVDLLAKFYVGSDNGGVGVRFRQFTKKFFKIKQCEAEVIYQLRNALLHSFGLYSKSRDGEYRFVLTAEKNVPLVRRNPSNNCYYVGLRALHRRFEDAIGRYQKALRKDQDLQAKFARMFPDYGLILRNHNLGS